MIKSPWHKIDGTEKVETISIKMTWADCLIPLLVVYAEGSATGRANSLNELRRMAAIADQHVADNPPADTYQCLLWSEDSKRWQFIAHGAGYTADEAKALVERHAEHGIKVRLLPC